ncbi:MAG: M48 family metallopeptidase [Flavobacteriaceae bacterium]|jgi:STE24 endopeptidase|nr:M48 family metallopeptidase [Flavobacteriaceae bacterium]
MTATFVFYAIIGILVFNFIFDKCIDYLNFKHFTDEIPAELKDVYDETQYLKSQHYKKETYHFSLLISAISFVVMLLFLWMEGFASVDKLARNLTTNNILISLLFFGILSLASTILTMPISYYKTFVIEEKFGFNKTTKKLFFIDKIKGILLSTIIGGLILYIIILFYNYFGTNFWLYALMLITIFSVLMNMFYSTLIVPLFNKQTPLEDGELKEALTAFVQKAGFKLDQLFVIDGSKRSTRANAYFAGFGPKKRVVLYDTLINDLETEEIVAVLAHEVGHYKRKHIIYNFFISTILVAITLYLLSIFINSEILANALGIKIPNFHIGMIAFGLLYTPISEITGLLNNIISRKFEYQADNYAQTFGLGKSLISGLKKLSKNNLSNLTPHSWYVFIHYSHPTLLQRYKNLN